MADQTCDNIVLLHKWRWQGTPEVWFRKISTARSTPRVAPSTDRGHCENEGRGYDTIEKTNVIGLLIARNEQELAAKRERLGVAEPFRGFAGTASHLTDLVGQYQDAGVQLFISSASKNDAETHSILASDIMPHFA